MSSIGPTVMAEQNYDVLGKAKIAAEAIRAILEMLGDPVVASAILAHLSGEHLAAFRDEHRTLARQTLLADIDYWIERCVAEPRKLAS